MDKKPPPRHRQDDTKRTIRRLEQLALTMYDDDTVRMVHLRQDASSRRMIPEVLFLTAQAKHYPWTAPELFFIGAAELLQREVGHRIELPF